MLQSTRRRGSSLGKISLGDTSAGLSTMKVSKAQKQKSTDRIHRLSEVSTTDKQILTKLLVAFRELTYRQTWVIPGIILILTIGSYVISSPTSTFHQYLGAFVVPSYKIEGTNQYGKGGNDFLFVFYYAIFFTFYREFWMCVVLRPLAFYFGITQESKQKRFMEQGYVIIYFLMSSAIGFWIMYQSPLWWFNTTAMYETYPHKTHDFLFKAFYLGQAAYWLQQLVILVLQVEKPRKDFPELCFHHVVTIALIWNSYRFHFTWMGLCVFVTMDFSDFTFGILKTLNYIESPFVTPFFVWFICVWVYLRHYINLKILWSVLTEFKTVGPWELNWVTQQYKCWISQPIVFFLIGALQLVNLFWLFLILRILYRFLFGGEVKDDRSDEEEAEDDKKTE